MSKIMSLDISTSTIGISILNVSEDTNDKYDKKDENDKKNFCRKNITLIYADHYKPIKNVDVLDKIIKTRDYILEIVEKYCPDEIAIEEYIKFMKSSGAKTIIPLAVLNTALALAIYEKTGKKPFILNVNTVRAILKPNGQSGRISKENILPLVADYLGIEWNWLLKKTGTKMEENYDRADGIAVGLALILGKRSGKIKCVNDVKQKIKKVRISKKKKT